MRRLTNVHRLTKVQQTIEVLFLYYALKLSTATSGPFSFALSGSFRIENQGLFGQLCVRVAYIVILSGFTSSTYF